MSAPSTVATHGGPPILSRADVLAQVAKSRRVLNAVLATPCARHHAPAQQPCWVIPSGITPGKTYEAVCDARIARHRRRAGRR